MSDGARVDHDANVIGAAALLVSDRVREAVEPLTGSRGASAAALTALAGWADGHQVDRLAAGLGLSHSRAVRVVDALVRAGHARRGADAEDGRRVRVHLTDEGRAAAGAVLAARAAALADVLHDVPAAERAALARACAAVLDAATTSRDGARLICRWCDAGACGHLEGRCPTTGAADRRE